MMPVHQGVPVPWNTWTSNARQPRRQLAVGINDAPRTPVERLPGHHAVLVHPRASSRGLAAPRSRGESNVHRAMGRVVPVRTAT